MSVNRLFRSGFIVVFLAFFFAATSSQGERKKGLTAIITRIKADAMALLENPKFMPDAEDYDRIVNAIKNAGQDVKHSKSIVKGLLNEVEQAHKGVSLPPAARHTWSSVSHANIAGRAAQSKPAQAAKTLGKGAKFLSYLLLLYEGERVGDAAGRYYSKRTDNGGEPGVQTAAMAFADGAGDRLFSSGNANELSTPAPIKPQIVKDLCDRTGMTIDPEVVVGFMHEDERIACLIKSPLEHGSQVAYDTSKASLKRVRLAWNVFKQDEQNAHRKLPDCTRQISQKHVCDNLKENLYLAH